MVWPEWKMMGIGAAVMVTGMLTLAWLAAELPTGTLYMTEQEELDLILAQQENQDYTTLAGIMSAVGFLFILLSFGTRRKKGGMAAKKQDDPPVAT